MPDSPEPYARDEDGHELENLASFLRRTLHAWPVAILCVSISAFACCAFIYFRHPAYRSETVILYSAGVRQADAAEQDDNPRNANVRLKELLMSRPQLSRIVTEFSLYPETRAQYGIGDAVEELKRAIEFRAPGGDTFSIAFQGRSPTEAQRVTQALGKLVMDGDAQLRKTQAEQARDFLTTERANKAAELRDAEQRLAVFMGEHRRFALDTTPLAAGAAIRASMGVNAPLTTTYRPTRAWSSPLLNAAARPGGPAAAPGTASEDAAERARATAALAAARANLAEQLERFTPAHPDVRLAQSEVDRATARLAALGAEPKSPAAAPLAPPAATTAAPAPARRAWAPVMPATPAPHGSDDVVGLETDWLKLTRDVTAARQRVDQVEAALFKADVLASSELAGRAVQISVIDPAFLPERPVGLGQNVMIAIFLGAGFAVGILAAALNAALDDRIYRASDTRGRAMILVEVPKLNWRRRTYASQ
jgi:uncharacterized protein involved in exopolysaccharide biosynthesis